MIEALSILGLGLLLGLEHAFDADHIVAVSTLISNHNMRKASLLGAFWGLGHTTTLFISGLLILILKITIPKTIALSLEFIVGAMIVALGASVLFELFIKRSHIHSHRHGSTSHTHVDSQSHAHYHRPFIVGLIHGLAGSAALMLLVLSTIDSVWIGLTYIIIFGIGSMIGMTLVSSIISIPFILTDSLINKRIRYVIGIFSMIYGTNIMFGSGILL